MASMFKGFVSSPAKLLRRGKDEEEAQAEESESLINKKKEVDATDGPKQPIKVSRTWDVKVSRRGFGRLRQQPRRIAIDIVREADQAPVQKTLLRGESLSMHPDEEVLLYGDKVVFRIMMEDAHAKDDDDDESSDEEDRSVLDIGDHGDDPGWTEVRRQRLEGVEVIKTRNDTVDVKLGKSLETRVRHINFSSKQEAESFCSVLAHLKTQAANRAKKQIASFHKKQPVRRSRDLFGGDETEIKILIEIVSGIDLPAADGNTSDAYCIVRLGDRDVHRTQHISSTLDPIWTVNTGGLCLLTTTPDEFFGASSGVSFIVKDQDTASKDDTLGTVHVQHEELLEGTGERKEHEIDPRHPQENKSILVLRYRRATPEDERFMTTLTRTKGKDGAYAAETHVNPKASKGSRLKRETRKGVGGKLEFRVKPGPDPRNEDRTKWLTETMINQYSRKPSQKWIEAGSGKLGRLYVELISCDGLPNKDTAALGGGKTDAFACLVYEDCVVNTEVINDVNSPRWMPWTQRAFIFNIMHPSSQLFIGLFDWDGGALDSHDPISRVTIDTTNFRPRTEYMLHYNLFTSALVTKRKNYGSVTVRLRMEWTDQRKFLLAPVSLRPKQYVNFVTKQDRALAFYSVNGKYDTNKFDTDIISSYVDELKSYQSLVDIISDAVGTVVFWRGHCPVEITRFLKFKLPLHSVIAFCGAVLLVENFNLLPSFTLFSIAWLFLATMGYRRRHPSPWHRCPSYFELFRAFVLHSYPPKAIEVNENIEEIEKFNASVERRLQRKEEAEEKRQKQAEEEAKALEEAEQAEEVDEDAILSAPKKGFSINPLKPLLFPLQQNLGQACFAIRVVGSVFLWEESYQAFWIVTGCVLLGLPLLFVPWSFLLRWLLRITVWTLLGPWMKLVDIFYIKKSNQVTDEEELQKRKEELRAKYKEALVNAMHSQVKKEDALKLRDMRKFKYGKFIVNVPTFKAARHFDYPLATSSAVRYDTETEQGKVVDRKAGQYLSGNMILTSEETQPDEKSPLLTTASTGYGTTD